MFPNAIQNCRYCDAALTENQRRLGGMCANWKCQRAHLTEALVQFRDARAGSEGRAGSAEYVPVVLPYSPRPLIPLPDARKARFLDHLDTILAGDDPDLPESVRTTIEDAAAAATQVDKADAEGSDAITDLPPDTEVVGPGIADCDTATAADPVTSIGLAICTACGGVCCKDGGTHAFLDVARVRDLLAETGLTPEDLRAFYVSRFPEESYENACVLQGKLGCTLPRERRAHICNHYACRGLKDAEALAANGTTKLFAAVRRDNVVLDGTFIDAPEGEAHPSDSDLAEDGPF